MVDEGGGCGHLLALPHLPDGAELEGGPGEAEGEERHAGVVEQGGAGVDTSGYPHLCRSGATFCAKLHNLLTL